MLAAHARCACGLGVGLGIVMGMGALCGPHSAYLWATGPGFDIGLEASTAGEVLDGACGGSSQAKVAIHH